MIADHIYRRTRLSATSMRFVARGELGTLELRQPVPRQPEKKARQISVHAGALILLTVLLFTPVAFAQTAKELKVSAGQSIVLVNMVNPRADCSTNPGPVAVPIVSKPTNGTVQMLIIVSDVSASDKCPTRKIPSIALVYTPNKDFKGSESVTVDIETGNQRRTLAYHITVQSAAQPL
jgi:hypothetical protein